MKIKLEGPGYKVELELNDKSLQEKYRSDSDYFQNQLREAIICAFGDIYMPEDLRDQISKINREKTEAKLAIVRREKTTIDDLADPTKIN